MKHLLPAQPAFGAQLERHRTVLAPLFITEVPVVPFARRAGRGEEFTDLPPELLLFDSQFKIHAREQPDAD